MIVYHFHCHIFFTMSCVHHIWVKTKMIGCDPLKNLTLYLFEGACLQIIQSSKQCNFELELKVFASNRLFCL